MTSITQIEKDLLDLPAPEREKLALKAWESLVEDSEAASDPNIDPEGVELARNSAWKFTRWLIEFSTIHFYIDLSLTKFVAISFIASRFRSCTASLMRTS